MDLPQVPRPAWAGRLACCLRAKRQLLCFVLLLSLAVSFYFAVCVRPGDLPAHLLQSKRAACPCANLKGSKLKQPHPLALPARLPRASCLPLWIDGERGECGLPRGVASRRELDRSSHRRRYVTQPSLGPQPTEEGFGRQTDLRVPDLCLLCLAGCGAATSFYHSKTPCGKLHFRSGPCGRAAD